MTGVRKAATAVLAAISVLSLVLAACAGMLGSGGETAERIRELEAQVERLQSELEAARAAGTGSSPVNEEPAPGFRHEDLDDLPADVRAWVDVHRDSQAGIARTFGGRTYVLVAYNQAGAPQHRVAIENVYLVPGSGGTAGAGADASGAVVVVNVAHVDDAARAEPVAVASIDAVDIEPDGWRFDLIDRSLPRLFNAHGLPDATLPAGSTVVVIDPAPGSAVPASFHVRGYARNLFEANLVARVMDGAGLVVLEQPTTAAACCFDWGSFDLALEVPLPAGDDFTLELGDYDMADGQWKARQRMTLRVAP